MTGGADDARPAMSGWMLAGAGRWIEEHAAQLLASDAAGIPQWQRHGIAPLVLEAARTGGAASIPRETVAALETRCRQIARENLQRLADLSAILAVCAHANIRAIALKGPTLAMLAYGDLARREFVDLDLLVAPGAIARARAQLLALGYVPSAPPAFRQAHAMRAGRYHHAFVHATTRTAVELHWALLPRGLAHLMSERRARTRVREIPLGAVPVATLGAEDLAVFLAIHGTKHAWCRLAWIADFAHLVVRERDIDWPALFAAHRGARRMLILALTLAAKMTGGWLPEGVNLGQGETQVVRSLADQVWRERLWVGPGAADPENRTFQLAALDRLSDRARYYAEWLVHPSTLDIAVVDLPRGARGLYYAIRPLRLLRDRMRAL